MQNYSSYDNSAPLSRGIGGADDLTRIIEVGTAAAPRKRVAEDSASFTWRRKTAKKAGHWKCATCSADNPDALNHRCSACGTKPQQQQRRDSITSHESSSLNSFTIDDLVGNLEGLEFEMDNSASYSQSNKPSLNDSLNEDSTASRFSAGNWSLRDLEKWTCSMCTFENEPLFCACEMCGQAKPGREVEQQAQQQQQLPSTTAILGGSMSNLDAITIRAQQEQRLTELLKFRKPATAASRASAPEISLKGSVLPPLGAAAASKRSMSPKPPRSPKPPMKARISGSRRSRSPVPTSSSSSARPSMGKEILMGDVFADVVQKPRVSFNPEDSAATATTFDMSNSAFDMSASTEWSFPLVYHPGIDEEEEEGEATTSPVR